jgi:hypothetical protein
MINLNGQVYSLLLDKLQYMDYVDYGSEYYRAYELLSIHKNTLFRLYCTIKHDINNIQRIQRLKRDLYDLEYEVKHYSQLSYTKKL